MKKLLPLAGLLLSLVFILNTGCESMLGIDSDIKNDSVITVDEKLHVKFINTENSEVTISSLQILIMGVAGTMEEPNGEFGNNILPAGTKIAPGTSYEFDLEIPNSFYSYCRIGVDDANGNVLLLKDQNGYANTYEGTITHWGSHERTVDVTLIKDSSSGLIHVQGWGEWAGIE